MLDLTRLMFDDGATRPVVDQDGRTGLLFYASGVPYKAFIHADPHSCGPEPVRGWWLTTEPEKITRDWLEAVFGYKKVPGWNESRVVRPNDWEWKDFILVEFQPVHGVWPDGTPP